MKALDSSVEVFLWQGACDMRMSFDRLSSLITERCNRSVIAGGVYVFFSRCRTRVKLLYWDRDGFAIWHKRLEAGSYKVARSEESCAVSAIDLEELLRGTELSRIILRKKAESGSFDSR